MNTKWYIFLVLMFCNICFTQISVLTTASYSGSTMFAEDPNLNKDWDWEQGDVIQGGVPRYFIFLQDKPSPTDEYAASLPWRQQSSWTGLEDRKKEDGWLLLAREFGAPNRRLDGSTRPYFVLYNPYRSVIRIFILLINVPTSFTFSTIELKTQHKGSGTLAHLAPIAYAMDKVQNMYNNATSAAVPSLAQSYYWVYGDFPLALDKSLTSTGITDIPASLIFDVYGTVLTEVKLETDGFGAQGDKKFIQDFIAKNNFGSPGFSLSKGSMPFLNTPFNLGDVNIKVTSPDWSSFNNFFNNLKVDMNFGSLSASNPFISLFDGFNSTLSALSIASPLSISGLDLGGIFNFFVGGGMKPGNVSQTPPTFISSHYSSTGTLTTKNRFASVTIPIPASRDNYKAPFNGGEVGIIRNEPVGLLTLTKTPVIYKREFQKRYYYHDYEEEFPYDIIFDEYEIAQDIQLSINNSSGLDLVKTEVSLLADAYSGYGEDTREFLNWLNLLDQRHLVDFEAPLSDSKATFKSMTVPIKYAKGRVLQIPNNLSPNVRLKIKAILKRKDDPNAQSVVFISTYNVDIVDNFGLTEKILPTIPPQNVIVTNPTTGGVRVSWDRNLEKNINLYAIERCINGASFVQIGTTSDTVFTDVEIQKAVKPYYSNRTNVSVNYRVKAKSYWYDSDNRISRSQYSNYSDIINISGSMIAFLDKKGVAQIIPESNSLSQNFPNPFNPSTTIYYGLKEPGNVTIKIFNAIGQEIITLVNERKEIGYHYVEWNATGLSSGIYFYKIQSGNFTESKKMILSK